MTLVEISHLISSSPPGGFLKIPEPISDIKTFKRSNCLSAGLCWALAWEWSRDLAVTKLNPEYCQVVEFLDQRSAMLILNQSLLIKHPVTLNIQVCYLWHQRSIEIFRSHIFWLWYISFFGVPSSCCPTSHQEKEIFNSNMKNIFYSLSRTLKRKTITQAHFNCFKPF